MTNNDQDPCSCAFAREAARTRALIGTTAGPDTEVGVAASGGFSNNFYSREREIKKARKCECTGKKRQRTLALATIPGGGASLPVLVVPTSGPGPAAATGFAV